MNWNLVATVGVPIVTLFLGAWLNRGLEARAKLVAFYGHVAAFEVHPEGAPAFHVFTHSVVVRNSGRRSATNVHVSHNVFPGNVTVYPPVEHELTKLPGGSTDLVIPVLVPGQQITISYLYFPPVTYDHINTGVRSNEGFAEVLNVLPMVPPKPWLRRVLTVLLMIGVVATVYVVWEAAAALLSGTK